MDMAEEYPPDISMLPQQRRKISGVGKLDGIENRIADVAGWMVQEEANVAPLAKLAVEPVQSPLAQDPPIRPWFQGIQEHETVVTEPANGLNESRVVAAEPEHLAKRRPVVVISKHQN